MIMTTGSSQTTEKNANLHIASQENIDKYLKGIHFPTEKKHMIEQAKKNSAPQHFLDNINNLKDQKFHNFGDISKVLCH